MHPLGWCLIVVLFLIVLVGWAGRPYDFKAARKKPKLYEPRAEELERRE